jgi:hypothetical protein
MLQPDEFAKTMSFAEGYQFLVNRREQIKQTDIAIAAGVATALCYTTLSPRCSERRRLRARPRLDVHRNCE